jgi:hypothetical protein
MKKTSGTKRKRAGTKRLTLKKGTVSGEKPKTPSRVRSRVQPRERVRERPWAQETLKRR